MGQKDWLVELVSPEQQLAQAVPHRYSSSVCRPLTVWSCDFVLATKQRRHSPTANNGRLDVVRPLRQRGRTNHGRLPCRNLALWLDHDLIGVKHAE